MRTRAQERIEHKLETEPQGSLPSPITDTKLAFPGSSQTQSQEFPISVDSDTEVEFANGHPRPQSKRHSRRPSNVRANSSRTSGVTSQDIHRAFANRRTWLTSRTEGDSGDDIPQFDYGAATPDPPPDPKSGDSGHSGAQTPMTQNSGISPSPSTLFKRLRTASFSPFASMRRSSRIFGGREDNSAAHETNVAMASSESSSDDDDLSILSRRTWHRNNNHRESYTEEDDEYDATEALDH